MFLADGLPPAGVRVHAGGLAVVDADERSGLAVGPLLAQAQDAVQIAHDRARFMPLIATSMQSRPVRNASTWDVLHTRSVNATPSTTQRVPWSPEPAYQERMSPCSSAQRRPRWIRARRLTARPRAGAPARPSGTRASGAPWCGWSLLLPR